MTAEKSYQIDPKDSWMLAAERKNLPMFVPGWEDSTLGNMYAAPLHLGRREECAHRSHRHRIHDGAGGMVHEHVRTLFDRVLPNWRRHRRRFPDLRRADAPSGSAAGNIPLWGYFCQISDSTTSYGSYSGAVPNEKITWGKLSLDTPKFIIESDATIVVPLIFAWILGW